MTSRLPVHEWCIILLFCAILLALAGFAFLGRSSYRQIKSSSDSEPSVTVLQVKIEGAVVHPGFYRLPLNATIKDLIAQAEPLPQADLSLFKRRRKLRDGQTIRIPERTWITIYVSGAVKQPGFLKILSGTKTCELVKQLELQTEADLKEIKNNRHLLREGDEIYIPMKENKVKIQKKKLSKKEKN